ncbi:MULTISPECIES: FAD-dependent monooxygenase [unclassified Crossiella]|uniref:FAD-dependent monooxygenase n=1 Tax=unclassified Crossiella TaxID=2620835 RepID=UPI001FFF2D2C|nr:MULTISPECIES: FAD-dependent monooxygenase [unclassified Crossiella]MCK2244668.1 FAD-dependent monooxygenase [Crossiella sp. S99.2]MCK2258345.1 FAD-dependent monooxygenase [Crossiella sp. S99.1]
MSAERAPVVVVGGGPIGLITALGLVSYGVPVVVLEAGSGLSTDTKAGTILTRTLEVLDRYGALGPVLEASLRIDEVGELDRATGQSTGSVLTAALAAETRFPFLLNIPQHELEPVLAEVLEHRAPGTLRFQHRLADFEQDEHGLTLRVSTSDGPITMAASHLLACDGGRSTVRERLGIEVSGHTLDQRYMLVDLVCDLDIGNPRDYPYLAYFGDRTEWMILVRQPHCWRFLFPLAAGAPEPSTEALRDKAHRFIGEVDELTVRGSNIYTLHHRVAASWQAGRAFLLGDAAHLITPMWALGLNTGVLDASNLPWRLAWVHRGWASPDLLRGYEAEQSPVAVHGSGEMAEAARAIMDRRLDPATGAGGWGEAMTRTLLGVRLDIDHTGDWSMARGSSTPTPIRVGERVPDLRVFAGRGPVTLHQLCRDSFLAVHLTDARRRPPIAADNPPGLRQALISRWDAPHDSGLRDRAYFDPGDTVRTRFGLDGDVVVLLRPDGHIAAIEPWTANATHTIQQRYLALVGLADHRPTEVTPCAATS